MELAVRDLLRSRFVRFLLVGGLNTAFGYAIFVAAILLRVPYVLAALISVLAGMLFNFKSYGALVFGSHDNRLIFRFVAVYAICYLLGVGLLALGKARGVSVLLVAALAALPMAALSFSLMRRLVFVPVKAPGS